MATTLPPIVHNPFGRYLNHNAYVFNGLREPYPTIENASTTTLASVLSVNPRQTSTSSLLSVSSTPLHPHNNENRATNDFLPTSTEKRSISSHEPKKHARGSLGTTGKLRRSELLSTRHNLDISPASLPRIKISRDLDEPSKEEPLDTKSSKIEYPSGHLGQRRASLTTRLLTETRAADTAGNTISEVGHEADKEDSKFRDWANAFRRRKNVSPQTFVWESRYSQNLRIQDQDPPFSGHPLPAVRFDHRKSPSSSSSGFVETIKTASFSNTSISIGPRSHRLARSTEARGNRSSNVRYSVDSDRPFTRPSLDEGAFCRGLRRRQILREILISEESYLVDLRALNNLFSTLLTSAASLSTSAKANIQRNLLEILHLHTDLANELYRVSTSNISKHPMQDHLLRKSGVRSHAQRSSLETHSVHEKDSQSRHCRHSIDSIDSNTLVRTAEPSEAADIARVFKHFMARFLIYEDYCSNHEIMLRELVTSQRSISSWPLYETGIEALTRSIRAINHRRGSNKRAMTVGDLLMSPIQRLTKYPLLFTDLHKSTPVIDCPDSHAEVDSTLQNLRDLVREVNCVTDDRVARDRVRKRWLLQDRLTFNDETLQATQFRMLGHPILCGVLHLAYQTKTQVRGGYGLCILFETHMVMAVPARQAEKFDIIAVIHLLDLRTESTSDGKGLQCHTALFSWKIVFEADQQLFEVILSACSAAEEEQWKRGMERREKLLVNEAGGIYPAPTELSSSVNKDLNPVGVIFGQAGTLARRLSVQRAATVGNRTNICQVIIRNTHKPQDSQYSRDTLAASVNRSRSLRTTHQTVVLAPKRNERIRLEYALGDVWTRDKLPYPGMTTSRSGQIIRASAGSLVRKLSLASMHTPFARRSMSLTTATPRRSTETLLDVELESEIDHPKYSIVDETKAMGETLEDSSITEEQIKGQESEVQPEKLSLTSVDRLIRCRTKAMQRISTAAVDIPGASEETTSGQIIVEEKLSGRKRWSNPLGLLKSFSTQGVRHMLYSSK